MQKIYCYVDETGQDTKGELFLVSVVIAKDERDNLIEKLEEIERSTRKRRRRRFAENSGPARRNGTSASARQHQESAGSS